ncbi:MAG: extracellular solute-binding protein [Actinobacteria bacterium]|nr:extracellular solute-binding protein [Actinomycetota bacterium]
MKKSLMWLLVMILAVSMIATFSLIGCKEKEAAPEEEVVTPPPTEEVGEEVEEVEEVAPSTEVLVYHYYTAGDEKAAMDAVIALFEETYPDITVIENPVAGSEAMVSILETQFYAGEPPDVFISADLIRTADWVRAGLILPVDDVWEELGLNDALNPNLASMPALTYEDIHYGIPELTAYESGIIFNKHIFDNVGIDPTSLTTVDALMDACATIKAAGYTPFAMGSQWLWALKFPFVDAVLLKGGVDKYKAFYTGEITADDPAIREALEFFANTAEYTNSDHTAFDWDGACELVVSDQAAMYVHGSWAGGWLKTMGFEWEVDMGIIPFPGLGDYFVMDGNLWSVPRFCEHPDAAKKFIQVAGSVEALSLELVPRDSTIAWRTDIPATGLGPITTDILEIQANASTPVPSAQCIEGTDVAFVNGVQGILQTLLIDGDVDAAVNSLVELRNTVFGEEGE